MTDDPAPEPWCIAEIVSELRHANVSMEEIAGLDSYRLRWIYFRDRDKTGRLVRRGQQGLPPECEVDSEGFRIVSNPQPFSRMFAQVCRGRRMTREQTAESWAAFKADNPDFERKGNY